MEKQNVDAKAAELREKLKDESLDKSEIEGGNAYPLVYQSPSRDK